MTTTKQLEYLMKDFSGFQGVFARDMLPNTLNGSMIINLQTHNLPGTHWICLKKIKQDIYYFDSLSLSIDSYIMNYLLKQNFVHIFKNRFSVQNPFSSTCGLHCVFFLKNNYPAYNDNYLYKQFLIKYKIKYE